MKAMRRVTPGRLVAVLLVLSCALATSALIARQQELASEEPISVADTEFDGEIRPSRETVITASATVLITRTLVSIGERVTEGQALVEVDDSQSRAAVAAAELSVEAVASRVAHLRESASSLERSIDMLASALSDANSRLSIAQRQMEQVPVRQWKDSPERAEAARDQTVLHNRRVEQLWLNGMVAKQELDDSAIAVRIAQNDLTMAQQAASAGQQFGIVQEEQARLQTQLMLLERRREQEAKAINLQSSTYELTRAQAELAAAKRQLVNTVLQATTTGIVVELPVRPGDRLPQGAVLVRLAELDHLVALIDVPARLVNGIRKGQRARLQLPTGSASLTVDGEVRSVAPLPDTSGAHAVEVEFRNERGLLLVSQLARVLFTQ